MSGAGMPEEEIWAFAHSAEPGAIANAAGVAVCVEGAEVIEHIPEDEGVFRELHRVLKPGGTLVLGTPDYSRWQWNLVEWLYGKLMPGGYADEHITHYTYDSLVKILDRNGFDYLDHTYSLQGDLIIKARKRK